jgi:23S rRNA pseudouridine2605 synthase
MPSESPRPPSAVRVQQLIAQSGLASRRQAEEWIRQGRVRVNGTAVQLGAKAVWGHDEVTVDGAPVPRPRDPQYWVVNKPAGYTVSLRDTHAQHLVTELLPHRVGRVFPVGRLDRETRGLLLLTDDGWLAHRLMHPRYEVPRTYVAWVQGWPTAARLDRLRRGVSLAEGPARVRTVTVLRRERDRTQVQIVLAEGKKREIRRLFRAVGHPVLDLVRTAYGPLSLGDLAEGAVRPLTADEVRRLYALVRGRSPAARRAGTVLREETGGKRGINRPTAADAGRSRRLGPARPRHPVR